MKRIQLKARAKINWTLDVIRRRPDGYHDLDMLMQSIDLADIILLKETAGPTLLKSNIPFLPLDERNIAYKAAELIKKFGGVSKNVEIHLTKRIPIAAGLGGGSADGAAVLVGLNELWCLGFSLEELMKMGAQLGADVPFCILGGTARAQGIGDILTPIRADAILWLVLAKPSKGVSTREVYQALELEKITTRPQNDRMIQALNQGDAAGIASGIGNVLETVTTHLRPEISQLKQKMMERGALASLMSGSGPTVYGIFASRLQARIAYESLKGEFAQCFLVPTTQLGITRMGK